MKRLICISLLFITTVTFAKEFQIKDHFRLIGSNSSLPLQIVPLKQTPAPNSMHIRIVFPQDQGA